MLVEKSRDVMSHMHQRLLQHVIPPHNVFCVSSGGEATSNRRRDLHPLTVVDVEASSDEQQTSVSPSSSAHASHDAAQTTRAVEQKSFVRCTDQHDVPSISFVDVGAPRQAMCYSMRTNVEMALLTSLAPLRDGVQLPSSSIRQIVSCRQLLGDGVRRFVASVMTHELCVFCCPVKMCGCNQLAPPVVFSYRTLVTHLLREHFLTVLHKLQGLAPQCCPLCTPTRAPTALKDHKLMAVVLMEHLRQHFSFLPVAVSAAAGDADTAAIKSSSMHALDRCVYRCSECSLLLSFESAKKHIKVHVHVPYILVYVDVHAAHVRCVHLCAFSLITKRTSASTSPFM